MIASKAKIIWLGFLSICLIAAGGALLTHMLRSTFAPGSCSVNGNSIQSGTRIVGYKEGFNCTCSDGKVLCTEVVQTETDSELKVENFTRDNLTFSSKYITTGVSSELGAAPLNTVFESINSESGSIEVVLEQAQLCTQAMEAPVQIGMYHVSKNSLTLLLIVNSATSVYTEPCTVQAVFDISKLKLDPKDGFRLQYRSETGEIVLANACIYNSRLFNNGDKYKAVDECNICSCDNGISRCSNDRVCNSK
jgi:hypothetical protein